MQPKVGIAIPCHTRDTKYLDLCLQSLRRLAPQPFLTTIDVNNGEEPMKTIRARLFNDLFSRGCDAVLSCDADFYLFPHTLQHIDPYKVTSFAQIELNFVSDLQQTVTRCLLPRPWSGLYSIPRTLWPQVQKGFDGSDTSVKNATPYKFVHRFCYMALRPSNTFSILKAIKKKDGEDGLMVKREVNVCLVMVLHSE